MASNSIPPDDSVRKQERNLIDAAIQEALEWDRYAATQSTAPPLPPPDTFPGYRILEEIHRGGQGVVYKALQETTKRPVAIKILHGGAFATPQQRYRFEREIDLVAHLNHPNIVTVYESGLTKDGQAYFAMEYVHGVPLNEYVRNMRVTETSGRHGAAKKLVRLFAKICSAVSYAHQHGVIHRDLKPGNIRIDGNGEPHILDFGLAKRAGESLVAEGGGAPVTLTSEFLGTLAFASPEQVKGDPSLIDTRTDVYSLGVILYEMLTGRYPYPVVGQMAEVLRHILETPPEPPSTWFRHRHRSRSISLPSDACRIDHDLETIALKALAKEKDRRYQTAEQLARDIELYLAGLPIDAKRDSSWYILRKLAIRHKYASATVAALIIIVVSFAIISFEFYLQAREALTGRRQSDAAVAGLIQQSSEGLNSARSAARQQVLGWFLLAWREGRADRAKEIRDCMAPNSPELAAVQFLLDESRTEKQLNADLQDDPLLAHLVMGERHMKAGRRQEALIAFEVVAALPGSEWLKAYARDRVKHLRSQVADARTGVADGNLVQR